jgi:hypothetical protein
MAQKTVTFEVYGAGIGFIGYVSAATEIGAKRIAAKLWPEITAFAVKSL